jgi:hypothetical protein
MPGIRSLIVKFNQPHSTELESQIAMMLRGLDAAFSDKGEFNVDKCQPSPYGFYMAVSSEAEFYERDFRNQLNTSFEFHGMPISIDPPSYLIIAKYREEDKAKTDFEEVLKKMEIRI